VLVATAFGLTRAPPCSRSVTSFRRDSLLRSLPLSIAPPAARLCDSVPPLLRRSNRHHNNKIISLSSRIIIFNTYTTPYPTRAAKQRRNGIAEPRSGRSDGEGERAMSGGAGEAMERGSERSDERGSEREHKHNKTKLLLYCIYSLVILKKR
jgi:hypothetical protein